MTTNHDPTPESGRPVVSRKPDSTRGDIDDVTVGFGASDDPEGPLIPDLGGTLLGEYLVLETIGAGGVGRVYKARHRYMGRIVAIKVLSHATAANPSVAIRFRREVEASAKLLHPNIVTAFDAGDYQQTLYLVMEYVDGDSLFDVVRQQGPLSVQQATQYVIQAAGGLAYAHGQGIIHRDIKPSNLMVDKSGQVKILDMGLARLHSLPSQGSDQPSGGDLTEHGTVIGTAGYISPEQIVNAHHVDLRTDIYSLACTYHYLLTGRPPYSGSLMETLVAHAKEPVPSLRKFRPDVSPALEGVFRQMMAKDACDRFASMDDVVTALESFAGGEATVAVAPQPYSIPSGRLAPPAEQKAGDLSSISLKKAVGFDVGTDSAHVSWIAEDGLPTPIKNQWGSTATVSVVKFQDNHFAVGPQALASLDTDAANVADRFVCQLGSRDAPQAIGGKKLPHEVLSAVIAKQLAADAQRSIGYFSHVVYTVPGCFGDVQRKGFEDAFYVASLDTLRPINAATAVVANFSFLNGWLNPRRPAKKKTMLVVRYGGGSFDATVFRVEDRAISSLAICGDRSNGGRVWDDRIARCVADQLKRQHGIDLENDPTRLFMLRRHCESGKVALTNQDQFPFRVQVKGKVLEGVLSRNFLKRLGTDLLDGAEARVHKALQVANVTWAELDHILLAGEAAKMPIVREAVERWSGMRQTVSLISGEAAPSGAALFAKMQIEEPGPNLDFHIREVTSHYLGVRGIHRKSGHKKTSLIVPQNTRLPATAKNTFRTLQEGQTSLLLEIVEGTDDGAPEGHLIGSCRIENLPPGQPAGTPIEIEFHVAENGRVSVFVESLATGRRSSPQIDRHGMTPGERVQWRDWLDTGLLAGQFA